VRDTGGLHLGCETFGAILEGAPGLSRTLLAQRLAQLERLGIVESTPKSHGRGHRYRLTASGDDLFRVCQTLGEWGARWLEIAPEDLDPVRGAVVDVQRAPIEHGETEICKTYPGLDEDLFITADAEAFVRWHAGHLSWAEATRDTRIRLDGPSWLVRAFPTWNARSAFAHIKPEPGAGPIPASAGGGGAAIDFDGER